MPSMVALRRTIRSAKLEIIAVGTELLLGQIVDTNSSWMGEKQVLVGIDSHHQTKVGDNWSRTEKPCDYQKV